MNFFNLFYFTSLKERRKICKRINITRFEIAVMRARRNNINDLSGSKKLKVFLGTLKNTQSKILQYKQKTCFKLS